MTIFTHVEIPLCTRVMKGGELTWNRKEGFVKIVISHYSIHKNFHSFKSFVFNIIIKTKLDYLTGWNNTTGGKIFLHVTIKRRIYSRNIFQNYLSRTGSKNARLKNWSTSSCILQPIPRTIFPRQIKSKMPKKQRNEKREKKDLDEDIKAHIVDMQSRGSNFYPKMRIPVSLFTSSNFHFNFFQRAYCFSFRVEIKRKKEKTRRGRSRWSELERGLERATAFDFRLEGGCAG